MMIRMGEDLNFEAKQVLAGLGRRVEVGYQ